MRNALLLIVIVSFCLKAQCQNQINFSRYLHLSLAPGLGTNGMYPGGYTNAISIHLTSGYAKASTFFELAGISNLNTDGTRGVQIAGITNFTGANAFSGMQPKEMDQKRREGFEANLTGAQFAGVTNVVLNNVFGLQVSGGVNVSKGGLLGFQLSGISNIVYKYSFGVQISGLANASYQSMDGVQIAALMNYTNGGLYGVQMGAFNKADFTEGKNSYENSDPTGVQIGLMNVAKRMNGFQIGIFNKAGRSQGTQIGLVNVYRQGKTTGTKDGTAIGLLNFGGAAYLAVYANELFFTNIEFATGNSKNSRISSDSKTIYIQNALIYSNDAGIIDGNRKRWAFGYGFKKMYFNRSAEPGMGHFRFMAYGFDLLHLNFEDGRVTKSFNVVTRPTVSFGSRLHPRLHSLYLFGAVAYNVFVSNSSQLAAPSFLETSTEVEGKPIQFWPGFSVGVLVR